MGTVGAGEWRVPGMEYSVLSTQYSVLRTQSLSVEADERRNELAGVERKRPGCWERVGTR